MLLYVLAAALVGAALGWWPLHLWTQRSLKKDIVLSDRAVASIRPIAAVLTAATFAVLTWRLLDTGLAALLPAALVFAAFATVLALVDVIEYRLPNGVIVPMLAALAVTLVLASALTGAWMNLVWAAIGAAAMFAIYLLLAIISPKSMGMGDVKLAAPLGLLLGWFGLNTWLYGLLFAFICGGLVAIVMLIARRTSLRGSLPFGPSMLAGALVALLLVG